MEQYLLIDSDIIIVDGDYELLKALGLIDDEEPEIVVGEDEFEEDDDADADDDWDEFETDDDEMYDEWDYLARYGEDAWEKLLQARLAHHHNILLRLFTRRLPNLSEQAKNGLFDAFFRSDAFGVSEHNAILDALAHPVEGLNLSKYDELGFY